MQVEIASVAIGKLAMTELNVQNVKLNFIYLQFSQKLMIIINSNFYFSYDISY